MSKFVVSGGAGFIGSHIVEYLLRNDHEVVILDNLSSGNKVHLKKLLEHDKLTFSKVDIGNWGALSKLFSHFQDAEGVFHLAACARIQPSIKEPMLTHRSNATGTLNVLEMMRMTGVKKIVYSASSSSYGLKPDLPCFETAPAIPQTPYAVTKLMGEMYCKTWTRLHGIQSVCLKYFNVYGRRSPLKGSYAPVIGLFFRQGILKQPLTVVGDGEQKRDFTHVSDVVEANMLAMKEAHSASGETINVGTGCNVSIADLANTIKVKLGNKNITVEVENVPERVGETFETLASYNKAEKMLGWTPRITLEEGLEDLLRYYIDREGELRAGQPI